MKKLFIPILAGIFLVACKDKGWSKAEEDRFTSDCERTATKQVGTERATEYCSCMLGKIKKDYNNYAEANTKLVKDQATMGRLAEECNAVDSTSK